MPNSAQITPAAPESNQSRPMLGIGLKVGSVLIFLAMASLVKAAGDIPPGEIVFYRSFFALAPILVFLVLRGQLVTGMKTKRPMAHLKRGLIGATGMGFGFYALTQLPLPEAVTIGYAGPLFIVVLSALVLRETVRLYRWSAVVLGLAGVGIIVTPQLTLLSGGAEAISGSTLGAVASLLGALIAGFASLAVRDLTKTERSATIVFYFSLTTTILSLLTLPFGWVMPDPGPAAMLIGAGICGGIAQIMLTESFRHAEMSVIAPFEYTSLIFSIMIGYWVFGDLVTWQTVVGGSIVVASGIFIILRERALGLKQARMRDRASRFGS